MQSPFFYSDLSKKYTKMFKKCSAFPSDAQFLDKILLFLWENSIFLIF